MEKILAIDDNEDNRRLLSIILEKAGYQVIMATSGREGLNRAVDDGPDLILLGLMLPELDDTRSAGS
jgi:two-component system alkaline phosphatase synthesis response regulator PhoP